jgi:hypothetical protein
MDPPFAQPSQCWTDSANLGKIGSVRKPTTPSGVSQQRLAPQISSEGSPSSGT